MFGLAPALIMGTVNLANSLCLRFYSVGDMTAGDGSGLNHRIHSCDTAHNVRDATGVTVKPGAPAPIAAVTKEAPWRTTLRNATRSNPVGESSVEWGG